MSPRNDDNLAIQEDEFIRRDISTETEEELRGRLLNKQPSSTKQPRSTSDRLNNRKQRDNNHKEQNRKPDQKQKKSKQKKSKRQNNPLKVVKQVI